MNIRKEGNMRIMIQMMMKKNENNINKLIYLKVYNVIRNNYIMS